VVTVAQNQEAKAWGTIAWDNAFAENLRIPFEVPDTVPFYRLGNALSQMFEYAVGSGLTEENLIFLATKALRSQNLNDFINDPLSWSQFNYDPLPESKVTFYEWFHSFYHLTRDQLTDIWNDRLIFGFVSKKRAEELLSQKCDGTFLLRFSESKLNGVSVSYKLDGKFGHLNPFTPNRKSLTKKIVDKLKTYPQLKFIYPNVPKDTALAKYCDENESKLERGYIKPLEFIPGSKSFASSCQGINQNTQIPIDNSFVNNNNLNGSTSNVVISNVDEGIQNPTMNFMEFSGHFTETNNIDIPYIDYFSGDEDISANY
jgi:hypothetical protein